MKRNTYFNAMLSLYIVITSSKSISSSFLVPGCDSGESDDDVGSVVEYLEGMEERLSTRDGLHIKGISKVYISYIRKFLVFLTLPVDGDVKIPRIHLTDENFAAFFKMMTEQGGVVSLSLS